MSLTRLLSVIGDENISYQHLENSILRTKINKRHGDCEITFATEYDILNGCGKTGLVIWVDTDKLKSSMENMSQEK